MSHLPLVAITMGDPAGIGPEVVVKALAEPAVAQACRPAVFGDDAALREAARRLGLSADWPTVRSPEELRPHAQEPVVCDLGGCPPELLFAARPTREGGLASVHYLVAAARAARSGAVDAVATAPINKQALALASSPFTGHTSLLADLLGVRRPVMMLVGGPLRVALATIHIPLAEVPRALSTPGIVDTATITHDALRRFFAIPQPRLAVCGLNPHAGEGSRFGTEELRLIEPAVVALRRSGVNARGPLPPDTCFWRAARGEFDAVVAMYHDQGLIPLKLLAFEDAVNVTLGLPIVRTSVDHGTAYDIAGRGTASHRSMVAAAELAARMAAARGKEN
ncbi:MAG: 4-hydroxythreonine-4-phosphate dehydrogenase PdxA [Candidatus Brocadiia bacterium]